MTKDPETGDIQLKASSKLELRLDEGEEDKRQYLINSAIEGKINPSTTLFTKLNYSQTKNTATNSTEAEYKEFVAGAAYRPLDNDRLNFLTKYSYLEDDSPSSQENISDVEEENAHVVAVEGAYDLSDKWQLVEKAALKMAKEKVSGFDFTESQTFLSVNRLNYLIDENWKIGAEYRFLKQTQAKDYKQGVLVEISRQMGPYAELGLGYNFTDFNDDLTHLDYTSQGPFIRITGKFYDRSEKEKDRSREKQLKEDIDKLAYERAGEKEKRETMARLYFEKGNVLYKEGKLKEAREQWQKALDLTTCPNMKDYIRQSDRKARDQIRAQKVKKADSDSETKKGHDLIIPY